MSKTTLTPWQDFLAQNGAKFDEDKQTLFSDSPHSIESSETYLTHLSHQSLLSVNGPDATKFLQGQITCDLNELANNICLQGAQCNLKGRVIGNFRIATTPSPDNIFMRMHNSVLPAVFETLKKYSVFSKLTLSDESEQWRRFGIFGPKASEQLKAHTGITLDSNDTYHATDSVILLKLAEPRYELWVKHDSAEHIWSALSASCKLINSNFWSLLDIQAGWVEIQQATSALFTPQALNLSVIGAVSFKKGCYTGQEVVARLHYKAVLKKHTHRIAIHAKNVPALMAPVTNEAGVKQGEIISVAPVSLGITEALAVLPTNHTEPLFLTDSGKSIERLALPYAINKAE